MTKFLTLDDVEVSQKTVLVRADLNVPMRNGQVNDLTRIQRLVPTIRNLKDRGAKIILLSHFGRPKGQRLLEESLIHLLPVLTDAFGQTIFFANDCIGPEAEKASKALQPGQILLLENLRFHEGEEKNDSNFAKALAQLGDIFVNDAFSCSHRAHASVVGLTQFLPSIAGRAMQAELEALERILEKPKRPLLAIVAGSKVSTKLDLLQNLVQKVDYLVVGGGMANTFLCALNYRIGQSLCEKDMMDTAHNILAQAKASGCEVILPQDVAVTSEIKAHVPRQIVAITQVQPSHIIVDIGQKTIDYIAAKLEKCATVIWNGPVGIFEIPPFDVGSTALAKLIAIQTKNAGLISVAGGGDTLAALAHAHFINDFSYTSTAGGAFLEWLEGKSLPGVMALKIRNAT